MKNPSKTILDNIRRKIHPFNSKHSQPNSWVIAGTPTEIMILVDNFRVQYNLNKKELLNYRNLIKRGKTNLHWFYFSCKEEKFGGRIK